MTQFTDTLKQFTHFGTVHTLLTRYDTVHTHFDIHFGTVDTLFTAMTQFSHTLT